MRPELIFCIDGVKFNHHDEKNVLLEFKTSKRTSFVLKYGIVLTMLKTNTLYFPRSVNLSFRLAQS